MIFPPRSVIALEIRLDATYIPTRSAPNLGEISRQWRVCVSRKESKWRTYFPDVVKDRDGVARARARARGSIRGYYSFTRNRRVVQGSAEGIQNGSPLHGETPFAMLFQANYLLRYFYIQYIRERWLVGAPSNPRGHTGDPSRERRNPT